MCQVLFASNRISPVGISHVVCLEKQHAPVRQQQMIALGRDKETTQFWFKSELSPIVDGIGTRKASHVYHPAQSPYSTPRIFLKHGRLGLGKAGMIRRQQYSVLCTIRILPGLCSTCTPLFQAHSLLRSGVDEHSATVHISGQSATKSGKRLGTFLFTVRSTLGPIVTLACWKGTALYGTDLTTLGGLDRLYWSCLMQAVLCF